MNKRGFEKKMKCAKCLKKIPFQLKIYRKIMPNNPKPLSPQCPFSRPAMAYHAEAVLTAAQHWDGGSVTVKL
jgi:hypothetical protein